MWVKADTLAGRWNPLVFSDGREGSAFHYSILDEGVPKVAVSLERDEAHPRTV